MGREPDGQLWPLVIAFCVLGGFLAGTVLAYLRLDDPRWYANAWTYLIAIPLVVLSSLIALAVTGNRFLKRTMQLALVLGLTWHLGLFIAALETDVFHRVWTEVLASTKRPPMEDAEKVPHFTAWQYNSRQEMQREFAKPVETEVPDPVVESLSRKALPKEPAGVDMEPRATPESQSALRPNVVRRKETNQSIPRRREEGSKLSRREATVSPQPVQAVSTPDQTPRPPRRPEVVEPHDLSMRKVRHPLESSGPVGAVPTPVPEEASTPQVARKSTSADAPRQPASAAALPRGDGREGVTPRSDVQVADKPAIAKRNQPSAVEPNNPAARKKQSRSVTRRERVSLPMETRVTEATTRRRAPEQPAPSRPELARTPRAVETRRQPRLTTRPQLTSQAEGPPDRALNETGGDESGGAERRPAAQDVVGERTALAANGETPAERGPTGDDTPRPSVRPREGRRAVAESVPSENGSVRATLSGRERAQAKALGPVGQRVSEVAKTQTAEAPAEPAPRAVATTRTPASKAAAGNTAEKRSFPSVDAVGAASERQVARQQTRRDASTSRPSVTAVASAESLPRRAKRSADRPSSPTSAENPVRRASAASTKPSTAPSPMALSKADVGTAGRGAAPNLASGNPAGESPARVASGSAQRAKATQTLDSGPSLAPRAPALVRHGRAGQARPSAVLKATPLTPATRAGRRRPDAVNASASAALTEAASDAAREEITASKGRLDVDVGPTTRVARSGTARAAGGGQPNRSPGVEVAALPRAAQGKPPTPSLSADAVNPEVAAPATDGGGEPSLADLDSNAKASIHAREASGQPTLGGPAAAEGGELAAPTPSLAMSKRRLPRAADGPQLAKPSAETPPEAREANRDRQLEQDPGVADVSPGTGEEREERRQPAARLAAQATAAPGKRAPGEAEEVAAQKTEVPDGETGKPTRGDGVLAARAEAVEAAEGPPRTGGGTNSPPRSTLGPELATNTQAELPEAAGAPSSSGRETAEPQSTQGRLITRLAAGVDAPRGDRPVGARPSELTVDATAGKVVGAGPARRASSPSDADGPAVESDVTASPLSKRPSNAVSVSPSAMDVATKEPPKDTSGEENPDLEPGPVADSPRRGEASPLAGDPLPVAIDADPGPGGLKRQATLEVGVPDRRASEVSDQIQLEPARFDRQQVGGRPELNPVAVVAAEPFQRRARREQETDGAGGGTGPETEEAIELGLAYLSRTQTPDGRWTLDGTAERDGLPQLASDTAATGLALLAFQGAGYNHREHRYAGAVREGIEFLVQSQQPNGDLYLPMDQESNRVVAYYSHSIAALALCEAYGMTQDSSLREPAQAALDFIVETQHPQRGGWRYSRHIGSDTSVTGWMMMALKSGDLADLDVPEDTYTEIRQWLDRAQASSSQPHLYCYNPYAPDTPKQRGGRQSTPSMTSVGLLMRLYSGWRRDHPNMVRGAEYLLERPPAIGTTSNPLRDTYYWYYATQVMFHMGGQYWNAWNQRLHPLLIGSQVREGEMAGSWDPRRPVPDRWAPFAGRLYVTTMNLLSLEVTYRYLPLYEDTAR
ncbi:MAG: hypothetical protein R6U98_03380 [Pirellulaceae bacterium]